MPRITKALVEKIKPKKKEYCVWDDQLTGFGMAIYPSGRKSFIIQYWLERKPWRMTLGGTGILSAAKAREIATKHLVAVKDGRNPKLEKQQRMNAPRFEDLCDRFEEEHINIRLKKRTADGYKRVIKLHLKPKFKGRLISDIQRRDIADLHHEMRERPYEANRMLEVVSKMFNLAEVWGWRPDNSNPRRHIPKYPEKKRERYLTKEELNKLLQLLDHLEGVDDGKIVHIAKKQLPKVHRSAVNAFRLLVLTGCRYEEIRTLKWEYVDWEDCCFHLPDSKTGAKTVPVSQYVIALLQTIKDHKKTPHSNPYVIYGTKLYQPINELQNSWRRIRKHLDMQDVRIHDLRHSFASFAVSAGYSLPMIGKILGHTQVQTTARYAHLMREPLKEATNGIVDVMISNT